MKGACSWLWLRLSCKVISILCALQSFYTCAFWTPRYHRFLNHRWQSWRKWLSHLVRLDLKKTHHGPTPELAFLLGCAWVEKKTVFLNHSETIVEMPLGPRGPFYIPSHKAGHRTPRQVWTLNCTWEDTPLNHFHSVESHGCGWSELPEPVRKQQLGEAHPGRCSKGKHLASCQEGRDRPEESLVQVLIFEKTSLQESKAHVTVGLSLTAAKLVKKWRRPPEAKPASWNTRECALLLCLACGQLSVNGTVLWVRKLGHKGSFRKCL